jgi:hypothetical protein
MPTLVNVDGNAISSNGPPYNLTIYGIPTLNGPFPYDPQLKQQLLGQILQFQIQGVAVIQTFDIIITDSGGCIALVQVPGGQVTEQIIIQSPTRLPNITRQEKKKEVDNFRILFLFIFIGGIVAAFFMFFMLFGNVLMTSYGQTKLREKAEKEASKSSSSKSKQK